MIWTVPLQIEHRPSASPYVERVWRSRSDAVARMTSVATPRWSLVFWEQEGRMHGAVQGPESQASPAPVPEDATFFGIDFALGATMPRLPVGRLVDGNTEIPDVTRTSFWLDGSAWQLPDYDNAEEFVRRLAREGVVVRDPLVADVVRGAEPDLSARAPSSGASWRRPGSPAAPSGGSIGPGRPRCCCDRVCRRPRSSTGSGTSTSRTSPTR